LSGTESYKDGPEYEKLRGNSYSGVVEKGAAEEGGKILDSLPLWGNDC